MSTYLELQDEVLSHQFSDTKYRDYIKQWLNEAQEYIALQTDLRGEEDTQPITTVAGTATVALDSDFARHISLRNTLDRNFLRRVSTKEIDDLPSSSAKPSVFTVVNSNLVLYPTPDAAYPLELRYYRLPVDMAVNGDTPDIPATYHHLLVRYALIRCYQRENDYEAANYHSGEFQQGLMKMRTEVQYDTAEPPEQVPGTWGDTESVDAATWY